MDPFVNLAGQKTYNVLFKSLIIPLATTVKSLDDFLNVLPNHLSRKPLVIGNIAKFH